MPATVTYGGQRHPERPSATRVDRGRAPRAGAALYGRASVVGEPHGVPVPRVPYP
ncbi:hypothetical protein [Thermoactinospora rubra]|uniref:hypothetical protein n=1 Tax=Thermoactinospora rubra TaxID=1088767 RepID=UPI001301D053|nr:hypothetical protein [Thermoactinospora rubra]